MVSFEEMLGTARMAVETCAAVERGDDVLVVTDTNKEAIAGVLAEASREVGAETALSIMSPRGMHGNEPPRMVAAAMRAADVIFAPTTYSMTHTDAMVDATGAGARAIIMRGLTSVFVRFARRRVLILDSLSANSYGIYIIHYLVVIWLQYAVLRIDLPAVVKGAIVFLGGLALCWGSIAALRRVRAVARII